MDRTSEAAIHRRLHEILFQFSRGTAPLPIALEVLSTQANTLFGTRRTSVWLHDRRDRVVLLTASSDPGCSGSATRIPTSDTSAPAARGLRLERAELVMEGRTQMLLAPLRGWRRALGTLVVEGAPEGLNEERYISAADELARQLAVAIENVQLLEEIMRQRRLLEDTFNSLADLVVVTDNSLRVVQTNEAFAARVGAQRADLLERPLTDVLGGEWTEWVRGLDARRSDAPAIGESAGTRRIHDERLHGTFSTTVTPLINREGDPIGHVLVARDVTEQTRLEAEQAALRQRLVQTEKLASLGQFVAGIAHEMNNALQGVLGHLELLIGTSDAARPLRRELRRIYREGERAAKIVQNLLVFTGSGRLMTRKRLDFEDVVSRALASRRAAFRRAQIDLVREQGAGLPAVMGDALLLHQALLNILINAEHALEVMGHGSRRIEVRTTADGGRRVRLSIRDSGPGIPRDALPRIFDPFFTTREVGQGTGLGLAITYGIVQEHGGTIQAGNVEEGGAMFVIELPAAGSFDE